MAALSSPSPYLQTTLTRLKDRGALIRRDAEIMLEGIDAKERFLNELRQSVRQHREEDSAQLAQARLESWSAWDERLRRIEEWMNAVANPAREAASLRAWRDSALGFDRAVEVSRKYAAQLIRKAARLDEKLVGLTERMRSWSDRLSLKENELREFVERQAVKGTEILVSKARKQPYLDFVFSEREAEGRLSLEFKSLRATTNRVLERVARAEKWAAQKAEANPAYFESSKNSLQEMWRPFHQRFTVIREAVLHQALDFEEGRRRLRWIYEQVQRMRIVQENIPQRRPLLARLFNSQEDS
jgi:hypothetical protein